MSGTSSGKAPKDGGISMGFLPYMWISRWFVIWNLRLGMHMLWARIIVHAKGFFTEMYDLG